MLKQRRIKTPFSGFYDYLEKRIDNSEFYRKCFHNPPPGLTQKEIQQHLDFAAKFPPDQPLERLVGHVITVYAV